MCAPKTTITLPSTMGRMENTMVGWGSVDNLVPGSQIQSKCGGLRDKASQLIEPYGCYMIKCVQCGSL